MADSCDCYRGKEAAAPGPFYGWYLVAGLLTIYFLADGIAIVLPPVLYPKLIQEFKVTEAGVSLCGAITLAAAGLLAPLGGALIDRWGVRKVMRTGIVLLSLSATAYLFSHSIWRLYILHSLLGIGLLLSGFLCYMVLLSNWFVERRGLAVGIVLTGSSLSGGILPNALAPIIANPDYGWRWGYGVAVSLVWTIAVPLVFVLIKEHPKEVGQHPDGKPGYKGIEQGSDSNREKAIGTTFGQALRTALFWTLALSTASLWFGIFAFQNHLVIYIKQDLGKSQELASFCFSLLFIFSVIGNLGFTALSDRLGRRAIVVFTASLMSLGGLLVFTLQGNGMGITASGSRLSVFSILFGLGYGGTFGVIQIIAADCFGARELGRILGTVIFISTIGGFVGITLTGLLRTITGSYLAPFLIVVAICFMMLISLSIVMHLSPAPEPVSP